MKIGPSSCTPAFTLVELLVVIAVVAVLIGLLAPALAVARMTAQRSACLANLRSLGTAITAYVSEHSVLPLAPARYSLPAGRTALLDELSDFLDAGLPGMDASGYITVGQPFRCPRDDERAATDGFSYDYTAGTFLADYGMAEDPNPKLLREITAMYESDLNLPVMQDGLNWHLRGVGWSRNALFMDGRADWKP